MIVLAVLTIATVMLSCPRDPYTYNTNLKLLVGDTIDYQDHSTCPVVSPDGEKVYFLSLPWDEWDEEYNYQDGVGRLYEVKSDGTGKRKLLDNIFEAITISPDGKKLAAVLWPDSGLDRDATNYIVLIDVNTLSMDTFVVSHGGINQIEFGKISENALYFSSGDKIVRLDLSDTTEQIVGYGLGFDISPDGKLYIDSKLHYVEINPDSNDLAISVDTGSFGGGKRFLLRHITTQEIDTLPASLIPYSGGRVNFPYWFPSGDKIVFSSASPSWEFPHPAQIWILENFFEQIE